MKLVALLIAGAMAATPVVKRDISAIASDLDAIQTATNNLGSAVKAFSGASAVSTAFEGTIAKKSTFVSAGLGGEVESQLQDIQSNSQAFSTALIAIVPQSLKSTAQGLADPIN